VTDRTAALASKQKPRGIMFRMTNWIEQPAVVTTWLIVMTGSLVAQFVLDHQMLGLPRAASIALNAVIVVALVVELVQAVALQRRRAVPRTPARREEEAKARARRRRSRTG
jgi:lysylphosphatidylglycerol synthetase-like protein (DUF2156 family)